MAVKPEEMVKGAFLRARGRSALAHDLGVTAAGYRVWAVNSSVDVDTAYRVTLSPTRVWACTCASGHRPACVHRAICLQRLAQEHWREACLARTAERERERAAADSPGVTPGADRIRAIAALYAD